MKKSMLIIIAFQMLMLFVACEKTPQNNSEEFSSSTLAETEVSTEATESLEIADYSNPESRETRTASYSRVSSNQVSVNSKEESKVKKSTIRFVQNTFSDFDNSKSKEESLTKSYNADDLVKKLAFYEYKSNAQSYVISYDMINNEFPIECIRNCEGNVYAIYKIEQGGYFYMFFNDKMDVANTAYLSKSHSYSDFKNIKKGTDISEVEALDPAIAYVLNIAKGSSLSPYVTLILKDGIIRISFEKKYNGYTVSGIRYSENFSFTYNTETFFCELNYKILSKDFPQ